MAVAAARLIAGMRGEESGERVSAGAAAQFAAGAGAFGWAGYARAWMDVKDRTHERASAGAQHVWLEANQAALRAYDLALGSPPKPTKPARRRRQWTGWRRRAGPTGLGPVREGCGGRHARDRGPRLRSSGRLCSPTGSGKPSPRHETEDAAGVLSRAATVADPAETGDAIEGSANDGVTWLRAPDDLILHERARNAAPRGSGVRTLVAHSDGDTLIDGGAELTAEDAAVRLGLRTVSSRRRMACRCRRPTRSPWSCWSAMAPVASFGRPLRWRGSRGGPVEAVARAEPARSHWTADHRAGRPGDHAGDR